MDNRRYKGMLAAMSYLELAGKGKIKKIRQNDLHKNIHWIKYEFTPNDNTFTSTVTLAGPGMESGCVYCGRKEPYHSNTPKIGVSEHSNDT